MGALLASLKMPGSIKSAIVGHEGTVATQCPRTFERRLNSETSRLTHCRPIRRKGRALHLGHAHEHHARHNNGHAVRLRCRELSTVGRDSILAVDEDPVPPDRGDLLGRMCTGVEIVWQEIADGALDGWRRVNRAWAFTWLCGPHGLCRIPTSRGMR
jgi:hypothetical protein